MDYDLHDLHFIEILYGLKGWRHEDDLQVIFLYALKMFRNVNLLHS
jgi:hypothetical protein